MEYVWTNLHYRKKGKIKTNLKNITHEIFDFHSIVWFESKTLNFVKNCSADIWAVYAEHSDGEFRTAFDLTCFGDSLRVDWACSLCAYENVRHAKLNQTTSYALIEKLLKGKAVSNGLEALRFFTRRVFVHIFNI